MKRHGLGQGDPPKNMGGMEACVASGILNIVGSKLAPLIIKEYSSIVGVKKDLQELHDQVKDINSWLENVGDRAIGDDPSLNWLKQLKDVAYTVDEFRLKAEKHDAGGDGGTLSKYMCTKPKSFIFQFKAARNIKEIKKRLAAIVKQRTDFSRLANSLPVDHPVHNTNKKTVEVPSLPIVDATSVLGREEDKNHIISKLVKTNDQPKVEIISLTGLGGSGKTTLAKLVFNDGNIIEKNFEVRLWIHVSQEFDVSKLIKKLFEAIAEKDPGQHALPYMSKRISDMLSGKRFLLVLDDVWTESRMLWEEFVVYLKGGAPGSKILLTTRHRKVGETVGSRDQFDLPFLCLVDSWQLFQQSSVMPAEVLDPEFSEVGKEIVKKCGGVPLAIKALASVLHGKERIEEWKSIRDSNLLAVEGKEHSVSACLRLSYFHMPSHLKECFTLCSLFPKGRMIDKDALIDQWIAHDMLTLEDGVDYLEYSGHKCFNYLVEMSFLQDVDEYRGRVSCRMHDLVHDLARSIFDFQISLLPKEETSSTKSYRYFSLIEQPENHVSKNHYRNTHAIYAYEGNDIIFGKAMKNARHLRSVIVESIHSATVPIVIFQATNLKYIHMSWLQCEALPDSISDVWALQALHVTHSWLFKLPESICKLQKLRTLNLSYWPLPCPIKGECLTACQRHCCCV